ncbi:MAG: hypothetical protein HC817_01165 [Saprospiraceae bacterium]|nr:hypothetical protein [Saprospiraceae bacterium]
MTNFDSFYRIEPNLHSSNFTNFYTMEDKKGLNSAKKLEDLKKELQNVNQQDAIKITGGKTYLQDKPSTGCGSTVPQ